MSDIISEQRCGAKARIGTVGEAAGKQSPHAESNRTLERTRNHHREPRLGDECLGAAHTTERRNLDDQQVCGTCLGNRERVFGTSNGLIGCDIYRQVADSLAEFCQLLDGLARLLDVFEIERRHASDGSLGFINRPATIRVDSNASFRAKSAAHRGDTFDVGVDGIGRDLDFCGPASLEPSQYARHLAGGDSRDGCVDPDGIGGRTEFGIPAVFDGRPKPVRCFDVVVFDEWREFCPAHRSAEERGLAHGQPSERCHQGQLHDVQVLGELIEFWQQHGLSLAPL